MTDSPLNFSQPLRMLPHLMESETGERDRYRLVEDMIDLHGQVGSEFEENLVLLKELKAGIIEGPGILRKR